MKQILLFVPVLLLLFHAASAVTTPDGHLLVLKALSASAIDNSHYISLFKVGFDGSVSLYWNYTNNKEHFLNNDNLFAVDTQDQLVYLGVVDQLLALRLTTGEVVINHPFKQAFWNYYYIAEEKAIYGMCTDDSLTFYWCRVKLGTAQPQLEMLYKMPGSDDFYPHVRGFFVDKEARSMWYLTGVTQKLHVRGVNYTTGKQIFITNSTYTDFCIVHDYKLNRTLTISIDIHAPLNQFLAELFPWPKNETILLKLPSDLRMASYFDTLCDYDVQTHTLIALMRNTSVQDAMPTHILLIDVVSVSYKLVPLPGFKKWSDLDYGVTAVKYIPNKD